MVQHAGKYRKSRSSPAKNSAPQSSHHGAERKGPGKQAEAPKMATEIEPQHSAMETENARPGELSEVLKRLDKLEGGLLGHFNGLVKPIMEKLGDLSHGTNC